MGAFQVPRGFKPIHGACKGASLDEICHGLVQHSRFNRGGQDQAVSLLSAFFSVIFHLDLELEKSRCSPKAAGSTHGVYSRLSWPPRDSSWASMGTRRKSL